jgi:succinate-semialdehyde dehydrogenase/glutarate-semialdehyde dehydrogenase
VGHSWEFDIGSLSSANQLATVEAHVADAVAKGATVLTGGKARPDLGPFCYEPTILTGVTADMDVYAEETFGPVLSLYQVDSIDDAVSAANESRYGLNASIWSRDHGPAVAARLRTGTVNINDGYAPSFGSHAAPMGGMKESGVGRRHGTAGLLKYTEAQTVADQRLLPIAPPPGVSNETFARVLKAGIAVMNRVLP